MTTGGGLAAPPDEPRVIEWRCGGRGGRCGERIGTIMGPLVTVRFQGHEVEAVGPIKRTCGKCGHVNYWPRPRPDQPSLGPIAP